MEIKIDSRNELFKRNEIEAVLNSNSNPSFDEVRKLLSERFKKPEENIDVRNILNNFGSHNFMIFANIYDTKENKQACEQKTRKQKIAEKEAKKQKTETKKPAEKPIEKTQVL